MEGDKESTSLNRCERLKKAKTLISEGQANQWAKRLQRAKIRFGETQHETTKHILYECESLSSTKQLTLGSTDIVTLFYTGDYPEPTSILEEDIFVLHRRISGAYFNSGGR